MTATPSWYDNEVLMSEFISRGGVAASFIENMRNNVNHYALAHGLERNEYVGYVTVEAPIGTEGPIWMFCASRLSFMPMAMPPSGAVTLIDPKTGSEEIIHLEDLKASDFMDAALRNVFIMKHSQKSATARRG